MLNATLDAMPRIAVEHRLTRSFLHDLNTFAQTTCEMLPLDQWAPSAQAELKDQLWVLATTSQADGWFMDLSLDASETGTSYLDIQTTHPGDLDPPVFSENELKALLRLTAWARRMDVCEHLKSGERRLKQLRLSFGMLLTATPSGLHGSIVTGLASNAELFTMTPEAAAVAGNLAIAAQVHFAEQARQE